MTTRTIETERTVTEEEKIEVCDGCGTSNDDGKLYEFTRQNRVGEVKTLHFHEECSKQLQTTSPNHEATENIKSFREKARSFKNKSENAVRSNDYLSVVVSLVVKTFCAVYYPYLAPFHLIKLEANGWEGSDGEPPILAVGFFLIVWGLAFMTLDIAAGSEILFQLGEEVNSPFAGSWIDAYFNHFPVVSWF